MTENQLSKKPTRHLGVRVSPETFDQVKRVADQFNSTPSDIVRECIRLAIGELEAQATLESATYDRVFAVAQTLGTTPGALVESWTKLALPEAEVKARRKARAEARKAEAS